MKKFITLLSITLLFGACGNLKHVPQEEEGEMVNLGYVKEKKENSTSATASLKVKQASGYTDIYDYLKGRVAGVEVNGTSITIRGIRSINSSNEPLILVDGIATDDISFLSPDMVQSIDILKDASSTAMYGSRGANGVILITTRTKNDK